MSEVAPRSRANPNQRRNPILSKGPDGRWLPHISPAQIEAIRTGYPHLNNGTVAAKFGISRVMVHYYRTGQRGMIAVGSGGPPISRLGPVRGKGEHGQVALAANFLARAVPLLRNLLRAEEDLRKRGSTEIALDEPVKERWNEYAQPAKEAGPQPGERAAARQEARAVADRSAVAGPSKADPRERAGDAGRLGGWGIDGPLLQD